MSTSGRTTPATYSLGTSPTADVLDEEKFNVELIVQCIRVSEMPQTHHHALLLLGTVAGIFPVSTRGVGLPQVFPVFPSSRDRLVGAKWCLVGFAFP